MKKYQKFFSENFHFLDVKFSVYLNRHVFVMQHEHALITPEICIVIVFSLLCQLRLIDLYKHPLAIKPEVTRLFISSLNSKCSCELAKVKLPYIWISPKSIIGTKTAKVQQVLSTDCLKFLSRIVKRCVIYEISINILVWGNYVKYYVWSSFILTKCSSSTKVLKLWTWRNARQFPSTCMFKTYVSKVQGFIRIFFIEKL